MVAVELTTLLWWLPMMTIRTKVAGLIMATFSLALPQVAPH
jgi:hypothetical protein